MAGKSLICPHCQGQNLPTADLPKEVVVVIPCPECQELAVLFRDKVLPVNRQLMQSGTRRQRILHVAEIITEFIDSGVVPEANNILLGENIPFIHADTDMDGEGDDGCTEPCGSSKSTLISDEEFAQFQRNELRAIDNAAFFRRTFG